MPLQKKRRDGVEGGSTARSTLVGKEKQAPKTLQHIRLFDDDIELAEALAHQRRDTSYPLIARKAFRRGVRFEAAAGAADEEKGNFATLSRELLPPEQEAADATLSTFHLKHA